MASLDNSLTKSCLVWLDERVNDPRTNILTKEQLKKCMNHLETFKDVDDCEFYIQSLSKDDQIILVINNHLGQIIVPRVHQLEQISSIYIYDLDNETEDNWRTNYVKVKGIVTELDILVERIRSDCNKQVSNRINEPLTLNVFNTSATSEQSTTGLNGEFVHSQLLINCLLRMTTTSIDKNEFIALAEKEYKDNKNELAIIHEFQNNYSSDQALWWYTRESFLYRQLNKALRTQNIDALFNFRFFIRDIEAQIKQHQYASSIRVFRGQLMSNEELKLVKDSVGQLISMNSFLSTSIDRRLALSFLYTSTKSDDMQRVLFEIEANPNLDSVKPFANIKSLSYFPNEDEILVMLGSIFRLNSIDRDDRGIWIIGLTLCSNNDPDLQAVFDYMKNQYGTEETTVLSVGIVLTQMGKYTEAEKYYRRLLREMSPNHEDRAACYHNLGNLFDEKGDFKVSLDWHHRALDTMKRTLSPHDERIATSYNSIAAVHAKMGDYENALKSFINALEIWKRTLGEDHPNVGQCLSNIAGIYQVYQKFTEALDYLQKALIIYEKHLPANHPQVGDLHNNIGTLYLCVDQMDLALEHFNKSLKIKEKCLPSQHPDIAMTYANIGLVFENKNEWEQALVHLKKAIDIYDHVLDPTHPMVVKVKQITERVTTKSKTA